MGANWLCPEPEDRVRLVDMSRRVSGIRRLQGGIMIAAALTCVPTLGWWLAPLIVISGAILLLLERKLPTARRPELHSVGAIVLFMQVIAALTFRSGGVRSPFAGWFLVPLIMLTARFRPRIVYAGLGLTIVLAGCVFLGADDLVGQDRLPASCEFIVWLALVISVIAAAVALLQADRASRGKAMVDPLTGLFNRSALLGRFGQAAEQAGVLQEWLSMVMIDVDFFKAINDTHGHDVGDAVLRGISTRMREIMRHADVVYRYGGEEFLLLLPGHDEDGARRIAERLRETIAASLFEGISVTVSAGVASGRGSGLRFDDLLREADQALYRAKRSGRDQICVA